MSLLARLFGKKTASPVTAQPINKAIEDLTVDDLVMLINSQNESAERIEKAIARLPYGPELLALTKQTAPAVQSNSAKRLASLIDDKTTNLETLISDIQDQSRVLAIVSYCKDTQYINALIEKHSDNESLTDLAKHGATSKIRQAAAAKIDDHDRLLDIQRAVKSKDKNVYKIVKDKLDLHRQEQKTQQQGLEKLQQVCDGLEKLASTIDINSLETRFNQLVNQWDNLVADVDASSLEIQYQNNKQRCQNKLDEHKAEIEAKAAKASAEEAAKNAFSNILYNLQVFIGKLYAEEEISIDFATESNDFIQAQQDLWHQSLNTLSPSKEQSDRFHRSVEMVGALILTLSQHGSLTKHVEALEAAKDDDQAFANAQQRLHDLLEATTLADKNSLPPSVEQAKTIIEDFANKKRDQARQESENIKIFAGLIRKANGATSQGNLRQAMGIRKAISEKREQIDQLPNRFEEQLETLDESINTLQDYRNFATEPKKRELISVMSQLAEQVKSGVKTLDPEDLADQIKKLQSDWKELVYGGKDTQPELWEEFHALSQIAYEPCKAFFESKSEHRKENLSKRKTLLDQLQQYLDQYDWDNAVWKDVEKVLRTAKQEWASYSPVDRSANATLQKDFNQLLNKLQRLIDAEYETNKKKKSDIVDQASKLAEIENTQDAIEKVKSLQSLWKKAGRTWQKEENKLWKQLSEYCDAVFAKKDKESEAFKSQLQTNLEQAESLCQTLEEIANIKDSTLFEKRDEVAKLAEDFKLITPLPKAKASTVRDRFFQAMAGYDKSIENLRNTLEKENWDQIFAIKALLNAWQVAPDDAKEEAKSNLDNAIAQQQKWPSGTLSAIEKVIEKGDTIATEENASWLHQLCIEAEALLDQPSPAEDQNLRMAFQVNRLKDGFIGAHTESRSQKTDLIISYLTAAPVSENAFTEYSRRFIKVIQA